MNKWFSLIVCCLSLPLWAATPLKVVTSLTDLKLLAQQIGGAEVEVISLGQGFEDPHYIDAKPSFVRQLNQAQVLIQVGLELESAWLDPLLRAARNPELSPGQPGFIDASQAIEPLQVQAGLIDRALGDIHARGNPHYLLNPLNGLKVAELITERFSQLRPEQRAVFQQRLASFQAELGQKLLGPLAKHYPRADWDKLARLYQAGKLDAFLQSQQQTGLLGGWLGAKPQLYGIRLIDDHDMWPYFAQAFGLQIAGHLEPRPGVLPSSQHLQSLISQSRPQQVKAVITGAYYDPKPAQLVAQALQIPYLRLAHQVQARPEAQDYLQLFEFNLSQLRQALD